MNQTIRISKHVIRTDMGYRGSISVYENGRYLWSRTEPTDWLEVQGALQGAHRIAMELQAGDCYQGPL